MLDLSRVIPVFALAACLGTSLAHGDETGAQSKAAGKASAVKALQDAKAKADAAKAKESAVKAIQDAKAKADAAKMQDARAKAR